jgi:deazaflavin-dependent oxidoreductase (nitroreductase family)
MTTNDTKTIDDLRRFFKRFNLFMVCMWRLGFRRWVNFWPSVSGRIMVIIHTGRRTGLRRRTPVNYANVGGEIYCTAGFGAISDWYRNIQANPQVEVWLPDSWWAGAAEDISQDEKRIPLLRQVIIASGIVGTLFGVNPHKMTDQEFDRATADYRLIHIRRAQRLSGPGGPGELAWVWIPALVILLILVFLLKFIP